VAPRSGNFIQEEKVSITDWTWSRLSQSDSIYYTRK